MQEDMKKLIAYSSVAHMGFVTMGIFAMNQQGIQGAMFQMLSHGLVSGALFLCVGVVYDRMHTREIAAYGGLVNSMPKYAVAFMVFTMANVGLPGTSGFVGEFLTLLGIIPGQHLGGALCDHRRDPLGRLCALALPPRDLRRADKESLEGLLDLSTARKGDPLSAGRPDDLLRRLSQRRSSMRPQPPSQALVNTSHRFARRRRMSRSANCRGEADDAGTDLRASRSGMPELIIRRRAGCS